MLKALRIYIMIISLGLMTGTGMFSTLGRELPEPLPIADLGPRNVRWTPDSSTLVFQASVSGPSNEWPWYTYSIITGDLAQMRNGSYLDEILIDDTLIRSIQESIPSIEGAIPISLSPTENYAIFLVPTGTEIITSYGVFPSFQPALINLKTMDYSRFDQAILTRIPNVLWSGDETDVVISAPSIPEFRGEFSYITHYADDIADAVAFQLEFVRYDDLTPLVLDTFDISADGAKVLLSILDDLNTQESALYLYDGHTPANSELLVDSSQIRQITAATFSPHDETKLWIFGRDGVSEYNLLTEEVKSLYSGLTSTSNYWSTAFFSPNGQYLAAYGPDGINFYVVDLSEYTDASEIAGDSTQPSETLSEKPHHLWFLPLTVGCPLLDQPVSALKWIVYNPNPRTISVTWIWQYGRLTEMNEVEIPGSSGDMPGTATFETPAQQGSNDVQILVNNVLHDQRECFVPREG
jgi:WD40 repeat protein